MTSNDAEPTNPEHLDTLGQDDKSQTPSLDQLRQHSNFSILKSLFNAVSYSDTGLIDSEPGETLGKSYESILKRNETEDPLANFVDNTLQSFSVRSMILDAATLGLKSYDIDLWHCVVRSPVGSINNVYRIPPTLPEPRILEILFEQRVLLRDQANQSAFSVATTLEALKVIAKKHDLESISFGTTFDYHQTMGLPLDPSDHHENNPNLIKVAVNKIKLIFKPVSKE